MASRLAQFPAGSADDVTRLAAGDGAAAHPYVRGLAAADGHDAMRNLADAAHFLCVLHGRHPGVIDHAAAAHADDAGARWLADAADAFAAERAFVTRVAVASGPAPSTPGAAQAEGAVGAQVHALEMLARSERQGCAAGAALALLADWLALRPVLAVVAARVGLPVPPVVLPEVADAPAPLDAAESRARLFGAGQLLAQHRGLADLLDSRAAARRVADGFPG